MAKGKKQEDPNKVAQRKAERVAFVQSHPNLAPEVARQRFYVNTRAAELEAAGKEVDRAALREKFQTGGVTREGFYTPGDVNRFNAARDNGSSLADTKITPVTPTTPVAPSATNVPTGVLPSTTSRTKTPPSSYQAPQVTTPLGQVVQPSTSYMGPQSRTPNPVRGGEPGRTVGPKSTGTPVRGGEPREPVFNQSGVTYTPPTTDPAEGREFNALVNRINPQAPANPKALARQKGARIVAAHQAQILKSNPMRAAEQKRIDEGYVAAPYDWTNLYRATGGSLVVGADLLVTGLTFNPAAGAIAAGVVEYGKNKLGNLLEQKTGFGGVAGDPGYGTMGGEGDTSFKHAAGVAGATYAGNILGMGISKVLPKIPGAAKWATSKVSGWADDAIAREGMSPVQQAAQRTIKNAAKGTRGKTPIEMPSRLELSGVSYPGLTDEGISVAQKMRQEPIAIGPTGDPGASKLLSSPQTQVKPVSTTKFTPEIVRESGLVIPATTRRTTAQIVRDIENATPEQAAAVGKKAIDDVLGKADNQPVSLHDAKQAKLQQQADEILGGGEKSYDQMTPNEKRAYTRKQNKLKNQNIEVKAETVGGSKALDKSINDLVSSPEGVPLKGVMEIDPRTFEGATIETVGAAKPEPVVSPKPKASTKKKPTKEFNRFEDAWDETATRENTEIKFDDVFDDGDETLREFGIDPTPPVQTNDLRVVQGNSRIDELRNNPATSGHPSLGGSMKPKLSVVPEEPPSLSQVKATEAPAVEVKSTVNAQPVKRPNETDAQFGKRLRKWEMENSGSVQKMPAGFEQPRGNYMESSMERFESRMSRTSRIDDAGATPEGGIPPKPKGLDLKNAAYDPETGAWRSRRLDKKTGEFVWVQKRNIATTPEEKAALTAASELKKQTNRKASRAAAAQLKQEAVAAANAPAANVEYGPFLHNGNLFKTKVELERGVIPDWAQQNINLSTEAKPLSVGEQTWLENATRPLTETETAYRRELLSSIAKNRGKRITKATREASSTEITEYIRKFKALRGEDGGVTIGAMPVALDDTQIALEREIEQVLGTNALNAIKSIAIKGEVAPLTQNIDLGLGSLAEVKTGTPLINNLEARKALPSASGRLREQAAEFFNAEGKLKGMTGAGRVRTWQRLTQSDWFRELDRLEPSFANYLRTQNAQLETWSRQGIAEGAASLPKPGMRRPANLKSGMTTTEIEQAIRTKLNRELADDGLGAYSMDPEDVAESTPFARERGLTVEQRSEAAQIERGLEFRTRVLRRIKAEDQAAFGDINNWNRGFEANQALAFDDPNTMDIAADYGIVGRNQIANISDVEFRAGVRELNQPYRPADPNSSITTPANELKASMLDKQKAIYASYNEGKITKAERKAQLDALTAENQEELNRIYDLPQSGPPSNPFAQEFGTELPNDYVRTMPESFGKVWDPDTWTNEFGTEVNGRWVEKSWAADKAASRAAAQQSMPGKIEAEWLNRHQPIDGKSWIQDAAERAQRSRTVKPEPFPMWDAQGRMIKNPADIQAEIARRESLDRAAAKARAAAPQGKTAEQIRFELKNPTSAKAEAVAGAVDPAPQKLEGTWSDVYRADRLDYFKEEIQTSEDYYKDWSSGDD